MNNLTAEEQAGLKEYGDILDKMLPNLSGTRSKEWHQAYLSGYIECWEAQGLITQVVADELLIFYTN